MAPRLGVRVSRLPIGNLANITALRASSTVSTIGMMIPSAPASVAFWMSPTLAVGTRTNGMQPAPAIDFDQLLRLTPGQRAVLHLDPDEIHSLAGFLRDLKVRADDRVAEDLLALLQFGDDGIECQRAGLDGRRARLRGLGRRRELSRRCRRADAARPAAPASRPSGTGRAAGGTWRGGRGSAWGEFTFQVDSVHACHGPRSMPPSAAAPRRWSPRFPSPCCWRCWRSGTCGRTSPRGARAAGRRARSRSLRLRDAGAGSPWPRRAMARRSACFPIGWLVVNAIFIYQLSVETGQFDVAAATDRRHLAGDRRIQALLIAFAFGAFIEGAAGFGAPVAISGALMIGLGFKPLEAAKLALIGNTAPVAFGSLGIPLVTLAPLTGLDLHAAQRDGRPAAAALLAHRPVLAGRGAGRLARHARGLAGLPRRRRQLRDDAVCHEQFSRPVAGRHRERRWSR